MDSQHSTESRACMLLTPEAYNQPCCVVRCFSVHCGSCLRAQNSTGIHSGLLHEAPPCRLAVFVCPTAHAQQSKGWHLRSRSPHLLSNISCLEGPNIYVHVSVATYIYWVATSILTCEGALAPDSSSACQLCSNCASLRCRKAIFCSTVVRGDISGIPTAQAAVGLLPVG